MRVFQINFDTCLLTVIAKNQNQAIQYLQEEDDDFIMLNDDLQYKFDESHTEVCIITDVTDKRGIIQYEQH